MTTEDDSIKLKNAIAKLALLEGIDFEVGLARLAKALKIPPAKLELEVQSVRSAEAEREAKAKPENTGRFVKGQRRPGQNLFEKGQSGNPSGKPQSLIEITRLARELCPRAIQRLATIMDDPRASKRDQIHASIALLERGMGKSIQPTFDLTNLNPFNPEMSGNILPEEASLLLYIATHSDEAKKDDENGDK
jgi:hypothetical protein